MSWPAISLVGGLDGFEAFIKTLDQKPNGSPSLVAFAWNQNKVEFKDDSAKTAFNEQLNYFQNLQIYTNHQALMNKVLDPKANFTLNVSNFFGGSGIFSYPLLVQAVPQNAFDSVYFAEIIMGNGNLDQPPEKVLIINKNDSWLMIQESHYYKDTVNMPQCYEAPWNTDSIRDKLKCVEKAWREEYRNDAENQKWIEKTLKLLSYSPL